MDSCSPDMRIASSSFVCQDNQGDYLHPQEKYVWKKKAAMKDFIQHGDYGNREKPPLTESSSVFEEVSYIKARQETELSKGVFTAQVPMCERNQIRNPCEVQDDFGSEHDIDIGVVFTVNILQVSKGEAVQNELDTDDRDCRDHRLERIGFEMLKIPELCDLNGVELSPSDGDDFSEEDWSPRAPIADLSRETAPSPTLDGRRGRRERPAPHGLAIYSDDVEELGDELAAGEKSEENSDGNEDKFSDISKDEERYARGKLENCYQDKAGLTEEVLILRPDEQSSSPSSSSDEEEHESAVLSNACSLSAYNPWSDRDLSDVQEEDEDEVEAENERDFSGAYLDAQNVDEREETWVQREVDYTADEKGKEESDTEKDLIPAALKERRRERNDADVEDVEAEGSPMCGRGEVVDVMRATCSTQQKPPAASSVLVETQAYGIATKCDTLMLADHTAVVQLVSGHTGVEQDHHDGDVANNRISLDSIEEMNFAGAGEGTGSEDKDSPLRGDKELGYTQQHEAPIEQLQDIGASALECDDQVCGLATGRRGERDAIAGQTALKERDAVPTGCASDNGSGVHAERWREGPAEDAVEHASGAGDDRSGHRMLATGLHGNRKRVESEVVHHLFRGSRHGNALDGESKTGLNLNNNNNDGGIECVRAEECGVAGCRDWVKTSCQSCSRGAQRRHKAIPFIEETSSSATSTENSPRSNCDCKSREGATCAFVLLSDAPRCSCEEMPCCQCQEELQGGTCPPATSDQLVSVSLVQRVQNSDSSSAPSELSSDSEQDTDVYLAGLVESYKNILQPLRKLSEFSWESITVKPTPTPPGNNPTARRLFACRCQRASGCLHLHLESGSASAAEGGLSSGGGLTAMDRATEAEDEHTPTKPDFMTDRDGILTQKGREMAAKTHTGNRDGGACSESEMIGRAEAAGHGDNESDRDEDIWHECESEPKGGSAKATPSETELWEDCERDEDKGCGTARRVSFASARWSRDAAEADKAHSSGSDGAGSIAGSARDVDAVDSTAEPLTASARGSERRARGPGDSGEPRASRQQQSGDSERNGVKRAPGERPAVISSADNEHCLEESRGGNERAVSGSLQVNGSRGPSRQLDSVFLPRDASGGDAVGDDVKRVTCFSLQNVCVKSAFGHGTHGAVGFPRDECIDDRAGSCKEECDLLLPDRDRPGDEPSFVKCAYHSDGGASLEKPGANGRELDASARVASEYGPDDERPDSSSNERTGAKSSCGLESGAFESDRGALSPPITNSGLASAKGSSGQSQGSDNEVNYLAILSDITESAIELESNIEKNLGLSISDLTASSAIKSSEAIAATLYSGVNRQGGRCSTNEQTFIPVSISDVNANSAFHGFVPTSPKDVQPLVEINQTISGGPTLLENSDSNTDASQLNRCQRATASIALRSVGDKQGARPVTELANTGGSLPPSPPLAPVGLKAISIGCSCSTGEVHGSTDSLALPPFHYKDRRLAGGGQPGNDPQSANAICSNLRAILSPDGCALSDQDVCSTGGGCRSFDIFGEGFEERLVQRGGVNANGTACTGTAEGFNGQCELVWTTQNCLLDFDEHEASLYRSFRERGVNEEHAYARGTEDGKWAHSEAELLTCQACDHTATDVDAMRQKHKSSSSDVEDGDKGLANGAADKVVVKQNGQITKSILKTIAKRSNSKKSKKEPTKKKNRVIFNESLNTSIDADYVILVREEEEYEYECSDDVACTCNMRPVEREMVRIDRSGGGYDLNIADQCSAFEPPTDFVDQLTLSPPEGYKDGNSHFYYHQPMRNVSTKGPSADEVHGEESGSESSLDARSEDEEVSSPANEHGSRDDSGALLSQDASQDSEDAKAKQRYIVETITMTTVTERRIVREADETQKGGAQDASAQSQLSGILKGGKQWKSDKPRADHEAVTSFASPGSPDDTDSFEKRNVRFNRGTEATQTDYDDEDDAVNDDDREEDRDSADEQDLDKTEQPSPDSTELTLTFKLGNHVLVANSLNPNSAVRQLFPAQRFPSANQRAGQDGEDGTQENGTPQQYLVTSESLKLFEESKRARVANYFNNQQSALAAAAAAAAADDDVPVNTNLIKRTIERNTLRRSLLRYEPGRNKRCQRRHDENSLVERIKQLTCDVDEPVYDYGEERGSPTGEESRPSDNAVGKLKPASPGEVVANGGRFTDKSLSPSSSSSSGSTASTYKKLTDLFARRSDKPPHESADHATQEYGNHASGEYGNSVYLSPPDLGNGLPLRAPPPKDFGAERGVPGSNLVPPKNAIAKAVPSEARKQFLSTLGPLGACVGAGLGGGGEDGDYYHVSPGMLPLSLRTSVASTNTESAYSLDDIEEALAGETSPPQPDVVAGTQGQAVPAPAKSVAVTAPKAAAGQGSAPKAGAARAAPGGQKNTTPQGARTPTPATQGQEPADELALFVAQDATRTERLKKRYSLNASPPAGSDDENDDYGFNRRPSVRGIKPRFGSTEEIVQQMTGQTTACARAGHAPWPVQGGKAVGAVRSPQMPCVHEENVVYYGSYNGNTACANQNFVTQQGCVHAPIVCAHQGVGCVQTENHMKDAMGRKYVSNSMIYASTGNLYENQNQIMRIGGGGCGEAQVYGTLGVRYLHHQTHLQHPGTSSSPPPGAHRDYPVVYNGAPAIDGIPPCMHQDPRFAAEVQNCQHLKERRFSGEILPLSQKEARFATDGVPVQGQKELRYSGEGLPTAMPNCNHIQERYGEQLAIANYQQAEANANQRHAGVGEGVATQYQDPTYQSLDRGFASRRPTNPPVGQMRVSPTSSTQTQQYQTTMSATSVRMTTPFPDPNMTAIIDPHYSTYRPTNPQIRVNVGQQQTIKVPYAGAPVQVHLMARGVRGDSPQRCGSPVGTPAQCGYPAQCVMARGTQTAVQQSYQGRGYYGQVAGERVGEGFEGYENMQAGLQYGTAVADMASSPADPNATDKSVQQSFDGTRVQQVGAAPTRTLTTFQPNMSPTKYGTERGVPEGAASVPVGFPQDSHYSSLGAGVNSTEQSEQSAAGVVAAAPGVYYAMNV